MSKSMMNFTKGIVAGVVVGTTVGVVVGSLAKPARPLSGAKMKKQAQRVAKNIGSAVSNISNVTDRNRMR